MLFCLLSCLLYICHVFFMGCCDWMLCCMDVCIDKVTWTWTCTVPQRMAVELNQHIWMKHYRFRRFSFYCTAVLDRIILYYCCYIQYLILNFITQSKKSPKWYERRYICKLFSIPLWEHKYESFKCFKTHNNSKSKLWLQNCKSWVVLIHNWIS